MPYLIFVFGVLIGAYAFYRFFVNAKPDEIKTFLSNALIGVFVLVLLYFAMSGKIIISIALVVLSLPFVIAHYKKKQTKTAKKNQDDSSDQS